MNAHSANSHLGCSRPILGIFPRLSWRTWLALQSGRSITKTDPGLPADVVPVIKQEDVLDGEAKNNFDPRLEHNEGAPALSHQAPRPLFTPSLASGVPIAAKKRRSGSPFVHLFGIVFFGIVGLTLGLGVLCFFGKASPIIQLLPENAFKVWLQEVNWPDIGENQ